ncbi:UNVERIFIED_CONTAM: Transcription factor [Sesamum latifolium]|uniref:Transcription factor n=1 Tax=Sesamum latifolium TaxID=2727402 RepID=A0AAW2UIK8_9LAMI
MMAAGNPNWWSMINGMHPQSHHQFVYASNSPAQLSSPPDNHQDFPVRSWSQLLLGGVGGGGGGEEEEEERYSAGAGLFQQQKKLESWEDQVLNLNPSFARTPVADVKQEDIAHQSSSTCQLTYAHVDHHDQFHQPAPPPNRPNNTNSWPTPPHQQVVMPHVSSPTSCITNLSTNILNFSGPNSASSSSQRKHSQDNSADQCNSTGTGGVSKKARVQQSSAQPALKVRKEKLGDRITALHQLVSPFGKTDTASVLSEAIGYIRFLQGQIEFLNDIGMERGAPKQESEGRSGAVKDLRSRGLCLVPISCTQHVGNDNGADYWAPAALGGGF